MLLTPAVSIGMLVYLHCLWNPGALGTCMYVSPAVKHQLSAITRWWRQTCRLERLHAVLREAIMYVREPAPVRASVPAQLTKAVVMSNYASRLIWETGTLIQICCLPANAPHALASQLNFPFICALSPLVFLVPFTHTRACEGSQAGVTFLWPSCVLHLVSSFRVWLDPNCDWRRITELLHAINSWSGWSLPGRVLGLTSSHLLQ